MDKAEITRVVDWVFRSNDDAWDRVERTRSAETCLKTRRWSFSLVNGAVSYTGLLPCRTQGCRPCAERLARTRLGKAVVWSEPFEALYVAVVSRRETDWEKRIERLSDRLYRKRTGPADFYLHVRRVEFVGVLASRELSGSKPPDLWVAMPRLQGLELLGAWMEVPGVEAFHNSQQAAAGLEDEDATDEDEEEEEGRLEDLGFMTDRGFSEVVEKAASLYERRHGFKPTIINGSVVDSRVKFRDWLECLTTMRGF